MRGTGAVADLVMMMGTVGTAKMLTQYEAQHYHGRGAMALMG